MRFFALGSPVMTPFGEPRIVEMVRLRYEPDRTIAATYTISLPEGGFDSYWSNDSIGSQLLATPESRYFSYQEESGLCDG